MTTIKIFPVETDQELEAAKTLFFEYADFLKERFGAYVDSDWASGYGRKFEDEVNTLPGQYAAPEGCLILARCHNKVAGCVALRKLSDDACEMRRLYVREEFRGLGIGKALAKAVVEKARLAGYDLMRLKTNRLLEAATGVYVSLGFKEISPYEETAVPGMAYMVPGMVYMELKL